MTVNQTNIIQTSNYYPFGGQHSSSWTRSIGVDNRHLFNGGSELNKRTQNYETFYRNYDPMLGRFNGVDIMATKYYDQSPYHFAGNNPVYFNDPLGDQKTPNWLSRLIDNIGERFFHWADDTWDGNGGVGFDGYNSSGGGGGFNSNGGGSLEGYLARLEFAGYTSGRTNSVSGESFYEGGGNNIRQTAAQSPYRTGDSVEEKNKQNGGDPLPELFYGGKMFKNIAGGLEAMWDASFHRAFKNGKRENFGVITNKGLLVLPNMKNSPSAASGSLQLFYDKLATSFDGSTGTHTLHAVHFQGSWLEVLGVVHTHPSNSGLPGHSPYSESKGDWIGVSNGLGNYVISVGGVFEAMPDFTSNPIAGDRSKGYIYISNLYSR